MKRVTLIMGYNSLFSAGRIFIKKLCDYRGRQEKISVICNLWSFIKMNNPNEENLSPEEKKPGGFIRQALVSIGLGIALLIAVLLAGGLFFNGVVVTGMAGAIRESTLK